MNKPNMTQLPRQIRNWSDSLPHRTSRMDFAHLPGSIVTNLPDGGESRAAVRSKATRLVRASYGLYCPTQRRSGDVESSRGGLRPTMCSRAAVQASDPHYVGGANCEPAAGACDLRQFGGSVAGLVVNVRAALSEELPDAPSQS